jgi:uncharacterized membrane protein
MTLCLVGNNCQFFTEPLGSSDSRKFLIMETGDNFTRNPIVEVVQEIYSGKILVLLVWIRSSWLTFLFSLIIFILLVLGIRYLYLKGKMRLILIIIVGWVIILFVSSWMKINFQKAQNPYPKYYCPNCSNWIP